MTAYADPHVNFTVDFQKDRNGIEFLIIKIYEFTDVPVICKKDCKDTKNGTIYYRNSNRRVESAAISNSHDMRNLIELASIKMMRKFTSLGLNITHSTRTKFEEELNNL